MSEMTSTKNVDGESSGRVMLNSRRHHPAPSILDASYMSVGIAWRPARRMIITKPRSFQAEARMIDGIAQLGSVHHPGPVIPKNPSTVLTTPELGLSSQRQ